jgi:hypothetical protein
VPALEPVEAIRVVATADALDRAAWVGDHVDVLRIAPDEALAFGATGVEVHDVDAIIEDNAGFAVRFLSLEDVATIAAHTDWPVPTRAGALAQGKIAGVPAKLLMGEPPLLVTQAAYAHEMAKRLGWLG